MMASTRTMSLVGGRRNVSLASMFTYRARRVPRASSLARAESGGLFSLVKARGKMAATPDGPIAIYYEHPDWFRPLFAELDRRGVRYDRVDAAAHSYDPAETNSPYSLVFNRASPSAYLRGHGQVTFHTQSWLRHLERIGVPVVNGSACYEMETSKALQLDILSELGLPYPKARVINNALLAPDAARGLRFPIVVKPNIGGSGAGITRFDSPAMLDEAARS